MEHHCCPERRPENGRGAIGVGNGDIDLLYYLLPADSINAEDENFDTVAEHKAHGQKRIAAGKLRGDIGAGVQYHRRLEQHDITQRDTLFQDICPLYFRFFGKQTVDALFAQKQYQSLDDVLNEQSVIRKRGKKNE